MNGRSLGEVIINIALIALFIMLFIFIFPSLFVIGIVFLIGYIIFQLIRNVGRKVEQGKQPEFDEQGRRITEVSVLEIKDADEIIENKKEKEPQERK